MADTEKVLAWSRHLARVSAERIAASRRATAEKPDSPRPIQYD